MKLATPLPNLLLLFLLSISLPLHSTLLFNQQQNKIIESHFEVRGSLFINLEDLIGRTTASQTTLDPAEPCEFRNASLTQISETQVSETLPDGRAFYLNDALNVIRVDLPLKVELYTEAPETGKKIRTKDNKISLEKTNFGLAPQTSHGETLAVKQYKNIVISSVQDALLFWDFSDVEKPDLFEKLDSNTATINSFGLMNEQFLFYSYADKLDVYELKKEEEKKTLAIAESFNAFLFPNGTTETFGEDPLSICICENIIFFGLRDKLFIAEGYQKGDHEGYPVLNVTDIQNPANFILDIKRVGRSLIVLTEKEMIEYLFIADYTDLKENMRIATRVFGLPFVAKEIWHDQLELKTSNNGTYFAFVNKRNGHVFIFESATPISTKSLQQPYLLEYQATEDSIKSVELYETSQKVPKNTLVMIVQGPEIISSVLLRRNPIGLKCSQMTAGRAMISAVTSSQFCHNVMYNFTQKTKELEKSESFVFSDDFYFNPGAPCTRTVIVSLTFLWSSSLIFGAVFVGIGVTAVICVMIRLMNKKEKAPQVKHKKFENEREDAPYDYSSPKIDVSQVNLPPTTDRQNSREKNEIPGVTDKASNKGNKHFTKKKNLTIRIPEN